VTAGLRVCQECDAHLKLFRRAAVSLSMAIACSNHKDACILQEDNAALPAPRLGEARQVLEEDGRLVTIRALDGAPLNLIERVDAWLLSRL
jgi:hypothetical protein